MIRFMRGRIAGRWSPWCHLSTGAFWLGSAYIWALPPATTTQAIQALVMGVAGMIHITIGMWRFS